MQILSKTEKDGKIKALQRYIYSLQFDYNLTLSEIAEILNQKSPDKLHLNKGDISKIQSGKVKFSRSIEKLLLLHDLLEHEVNQLENNASSKDIQPKITTQNLLNYFTNIQYNIVNEPEFNLYQIFAKKLFPSRLNHFFVFLFFVLLSPAIPVIWAINTGVWNGIDYPLSESYSTWIGESILAIINVIILDYYKHFAYLLNFSERIKKIANNRTWQLALLFLSLLFSYYFHNRFTKDQLFGWCEESLGVLSYLGHYHAVIFALQLWIIFSFVINVYLTKLAIIELEKKYTNTNNGLMLYKKGIVKSLSKLIIKYGEALLINGIYVFAFLYTIYHSIDKLELKKVPVNTGLLELIGYISIFLVFGLGFFWLFMIKPVIELLENNKKRLLKQYPENNTILSIQIFPFNENPFGYLLISFLTIITIISISLVSIDLINRIIESRLLIMTFLIY